MSRRDILARYDGMFPDVQDTAQEMPATVTNEELFFTKNMKDWFNSALNALPAMGPGYFMIVSK